MIQIYFQAKTLLAISVVLLTALEAPSSINQFLLSAFIPPAYADKTVDADVIYTRWESLPPDSHLRSAFETMGSKLINHGNIVAEKDDKPILIRGGGFTKANLNWLIQDMGVRTIIDLRGHYPIDQAPQMIVHSSQLKGQYEKENRLNELKNLSPKMARRYVETLAKNANLPVRYLQINATDPKLQDYLMEASLQNPTAMFCQRGLNRSGTAWSIMAARKNWPQERAFALFGEKSSPDGRYLNNRDIKRGYQIEKEILKR